MIDERYLRHRYKSTSHAAVITAVLAGGFFLYEHLFNGKFRTDLAVILIAAAMTKLGFMVYYRFTD